MTKLKTQQKKNTKHNCKFRKKKKSTLKQNAKGTSLLNITKEKNSRFSALKQHFNMKLFMLL